MFKTQEQSQIYLGYTMMLNEIRVGTMEIKAAHQSLVIGEQKLKSLKRELAHIEENEGNRDKKQSK